MSTDYRHLIRAHINTVEQRCVHMLKRCSDEWDAGQHIMRHSFDHSHNHCYFMYSYTEPKPRLFVIVSQAMITEASNEALNNCLRQREICLCLCVQTVNVNASYLNLALFLSGRKWHSCSPQMTTQSSQCFRIAIRNLYHFDEIIFQQLFSSHAFLSLVLHRRANIKRFRSGFI